MLKGFLGAVFRYTPKPLRRLFSRVTNARFSVTAGAVITDNEGRVLLLKHVFRSGNGWGIPGGFVQAGEQPSAALQRELREEVGLELVAIEMVFARTLHTTQQIEIIFRARPNGEAQPQSVEIESVGWFSPQTLPEGLPEDQRRLIDGVLADGANRPS
jgi:ADP-ribose pyrophosphatase YjhB (NUDIX family)